MPPNRETILPPPQYRILTLYEVSEATPDAACRYCGREYPMSWQLLLGEKGISIEHFTGLLNVLYPPGSIIETIPGSYRILACSCPEAATAFPESNAPADEECEGSCPRCCRE